MVCYSKEHELKTIISSTGLEFEIRFINVFLTRMVLTEKLYYKFKEKCIYDGI